MIQAKLEYPLFKIEAQWKEAARASDAEFRGFLMVVIGIIGFILMGAASAACFSIFEEKGSAFAATLSSWIAIVAIATLFVVIISSTHKTKPMTVKTFDWWDKYKTGDRLVDDIVNITIDHFSDEQQISMDGVAIIDNLIHGYNLSRTRKTQLYGQKEDLGQKLQKLAAEISLLPPTLHTRQTI